MVHASGIAKEAASYEDAGLDSYTEYSYRVEATYNDGDKTGRTKSEYVTAGTSPPPPSDFEAILEDGGTIVRTTWTHSDPRELDYVVRWKLADEGDESWTRITPIPSSGEGAPMSLSFGVAGLSCSDTLEVQIRARLRDSQSWGIWSHPPEDVMRECDPPPPPTGLDVKAKSDSAMDLVWDFSGDTAAVTDYRVEYQELTVEPTASWAEWQHVEKYPGNAVRIRGLTCNREYRLRLRLLGDGDVYEDEWSGGAITDEQRTDPCVASDTSQSVLNRSFNLVVGSGDARETVAHATFIASWQTILQTVNGVPYSYNKFLSHGLQATIPQRSLDRPTFDRGEATAFYYRNDDMPQWFHNNYSNVMDQYDSEVFNNFVLNGDYSVYSDVTWGETNVSGDKVVVGTLSDVAETIDRVWTISKIIMKHIDTPQHALFIRTFDCEIPLWGSQSPAFSDDVTTCIGSEVSVSLDD